MARSRFTASEQGEDRQPEDVRLRKNSSSQGSSMAGLIWWTATHIFLALLIVILLSAWMTRRHGGFAWKDSQNLLGMENYHGLLTTLGFIVFSGVGDILYRMARNTTKIYVKIAHATFQITAFSLAVAGVTAMWWFHDVNGWGHFGSAHSWIGLIVLLIFSSQWLLGFLGFLYPDFNPSQRASLLPIHVFLGHTSFILSIVTVLLGLTKLGPLNGDNTTTLNVTAFALIAFGFTGEYLLTKRAFKRPADSESSPAAAGYVPIDRRDSTGSRRSKRSNRSNQARDVESPARTFVNVPGSQGNYQNLDGPEKEEAFATDADSLQKLQENLTTTRSGAPQINIVNFDES